ncbi:MAG TPA: lysylphosphatidylglycerol synthase transmembrane domain-containing protein [Candidatus Andersenbacteria bacterium]|nr:lysylphosphatidylglycerol synthase transmembrane domain-containing protein [Candidatus Andersenbacteria bacterium]
MAKEKIKIPALTWIIGFCALVSFIWLIATHVGEAERFIQLTAHAEPLWILIALLLQMGTYASAGAVWHLVAKSADYHLRVPALARLSIEKLSLNQLLPTAGMAGNLVVIRAMRRLGIPASLAMEALLVEILSHYAAFALVAITTCIILWSHHSITPVVIGLVGTFSLFITIAPLTIWWALHNRNWKPPTWVLRFEIADRAFTAIQNVSPERIRSAPLLTKSILLQITTFILDSATLWTMMQAIEISLNPLTAFSAVVMGSIAGTVSFLPGGIGGFEIGCTITLILLGISPEAALTGTLLLRGLTFWLPIIPGLLLARREIILEP